MFLFVGVTKMVPAWRSPIPERVTPPWFRRGGGESGGCESCRPLPEILRRAQGGWRRPLTGSNSALPVEPAGGL